MRAIGIGQFYEKPYKGITRGTRDGFESLGWEFIPVPFENETELKNIFNQLCELKPDIIFSHSILDRGNFKTNDVVAMFSMVKRITGAKLVYQEGDYKDIRERPEADLNEFDLILFNQEHQLKEHSEKWNIDIEKCVVFPYASFIYKNYPLTFIKNLKCNYDFVFIGGIGQHYPFRLEVLEKLKDHIYVLPNRGINGELCYKYGEHIYSNSKVCLSVDYVQDILHFTSDRQFKIMGAGGLCLCHRAKGLDKIFIDNEHLIFFNTQEEALEKYLKIKDNKVINEQIKKQTFQFVQKWHTWKNRISDLILILEGKKDKITFEYKEIYDNKTTGIFE